MFNKDLELIHTDYKRFALMVAEGLLFKNYPENVRDFSGTAEEIRKRILDKRNDLIAQALIQGMVDIGEEHAKANYYYWETMAGSDFRDVLSKIDVPTMRTRDPVIVRPLRNIWSHRFPGQFGYRYMDVHIWRRQRVRRSGVVVS